MVHNRLRAPVILPFGYSIWIIGSIFSQIADNANSQFENEQHYYSKWQCLFISVHSQEHRLQQSWDNNGCSREDRAAFSTGWFAHVMERFPPERGVFQECLPTLEAKGVSIRPLASQRSRAISAIFIQINFQYLICS